MSILVVGYAAFFPSQPSRDSNLAIFLALSEDDWLIIGSTPKRLIYWFNGEESPSSITEDGTVYYIDYYILSVSTVVHSQEFMDELLSICPDYPNELNTEIDSLATGCSKGVRKGTKFFGGAEILGGHAILGIPTVLETYRNGLTESYERSL